MFKKCHERVVGSEPKEGGDVFVTRFLFLSSEPSPPAGTSCFSLLNRKRFFTSLKLLPLSPPQRCKRYSTPPGRTTNVLWKRTDLYLSLSQCQDVRTPELMPLSFPPTCAIEGDGRTGSRPEFWFRFPLNTSGTFRWKHEVKHRAASSRLTARNRLIKILSNCSSDHIFHTTPVVTSFLQEVLQLAATVSV